MQALIQQGWEIGILKEKLREKKNLRKRKI
jgi:hypothetical protein